ncbi:MAG: transcription-repair coupling factor, partial [Muribaculaceae bacterium]|nr:transcription-repair coupling factor [Muribaculaceae bacterium]
MELKEADLLFTTPARIGALEKGLKDKKCRRIFLGGLPGSSPAMLFGALHKQGTPALIVMDDMDSAGYMYHDLCQILGEENIAVFPSGYKRDIKYGQPDPPQQILRTETLDALRSKKGLRYVVSYPEALAE